MPGYGPSRMGMRGLVTQMLPGGRKSAVTLSGLLNVLDGVGSEEGKLFFATVSSFLIPNKFEFQTNALW